MLVPNPILIIQSISFQTSTECKETFSRDFNSNVRFVIKKFHGFDSNKTLFVGALLVLESNSERLVWAL
jgi:hypothetical protein